MAKRVLLAHLESAASLPYRKSYWHFADFLIGELEKCVTAAPKLQILALASGTRNLFEVSLVVEYACTSDQNMDRFVIDAAIDELEIMQKLLEKEQREENYHRDAKSQQREQNLRAQIADAGLIGKGPFKHSRLQRRLDVNMSAVISTRSSQFGRIALRQL